jgi:flagellar biosynthesis/type III secretory pathway protein FliH
LSHNNKLDYDTGFRDGYRVGVQDGWAKGYDSGTIDGFRQGVASVREAHMPCTGEEDEEEATSKK